MTELAEIPPPLRSLPVPETSASLWRTFDYFSYYRLTVASVFVIGGLFFERVTDPANDRPLFVQVALVYWLVALSFVLTRKLRWASLDRMLTVQVTIDTLALTLLMYASGGHSSGLAVMLIVVVAGAGLVGQGRLSVFYAAMATLAVLAEQAYRTVYVAGDAAGFVAVGIISIGFFATAISARLLAQRVIAHQEIARRRGIDLDNQLRVNERIIRDMQDGVLVVDAGGCILQFNPQAKSLLGSKLAVAEFVADVSAPLTSRLEIFLSGQGDAHAVVASAVGQAAIRARFVRPAEGGTILVYLENLERMQAQAQQIKLAALGRLTASIAHEIRNPLAAISHAAELLQEERRGETLTRLARIVRDNTQRIDRMVKEILELGRRDRAEPEPLNLSGFLRGFVEEFCIHDQTPQDILRIDDAPGLTLVFDRAHLNQVLWNILTNSLRYCSRADGSITLRTGSADSGSRVEIHIVDDGPGIPAEVRTRVFEPFFTTHSKGTGLGLYIARELCEANRATLELLETPTGTHFRITGTAGKP